MDLLDSSPGRDFLWSLRASGPPPVAMETRVLARQMKTIGAPFFAPRYWLELWELGNRPVAFGGFKALLRPLVDDDDIGEVRSACEPELALIAAVGDLRQVGERSGWWSDRWAASLDGWRGYDVDGAPSIFLVAAIEGAYPLPTTFREAHDEYAYWAWRAFMIGAVDVDGDDVEALDALREPELDLVCQVRIERVRRLLVSDLVATSIEDVETRLRMYLFVDGRDYRVEASAMRDLGHLRKTAARPASTAVPEPTNVPPVASVQSVGESQPPKVPKERRKPGVQNPAVTAELRADATQSDRAIARKVGVQPTTVGDERRRLGLEDVVRSVSRKNVKGAYAMRRRAVGPRHAAAAAASAPPRVEPSPPSMPQHTSLAPSSRPDAAKKVRKAGSSSSIRDEQLFFPWRSDQSS